MDGEVLPEEADGRPWVGDEVEAGDGEEGSAGRVLRFKLAGLWKIVFQRSIFGFHVSFWECMWEKNHIPYCTRAFKGWLMDSLTWKWKNPVCKGKCFFLLGPYHPLPGLLSGCLFIASKSCDSGCPCLPRLEGPGTWIILTICRAVGIPTCRAVYVQLIG